MSAENSFSCPQFIPPSGAVLDILVTNENTKTQQLNKNVEPKNIINSWENANYFFYLEEKEMYVNFDIQHKTTIMGNFSEDDKYSFTFYWKIPQLYPVTPYIYQ